MNDYMGTAQTVEEAECSKAWTQTEARRTERLNQTLRSAPTPRPPIEEIAQRLGALHERLVVGLTSAIDTLDQHADRLFGCIPETTGMNSAKGVGIPDCGPGAMGALFATLAMLEDTANILTEKLHVAVHRNTHVA